MKQKISEYEELKELEIKKNNVFYKNHIKQLQKYVPEINYLDIGSKGGVQGWFNLIKENLNTIPFDAESDEALFLILKEKKLLFNGN